VPVGYEVAVALDAPLDVLVVRKLGAPGHGELAVGAIASGGARVLNHEVVRSLGLDDATLDRIETAERLELERRESLYRGNKPPLDVAGSSVILVDDGVATGATMLVAVAALRQLGAESVVVAVPVGAPDALARLELAADEVVCLLSPPYLVSVGQWYDDFSQTTDAEVKALVEG
jgi:predicted phosphoribosyltransferase